MLPPLDTSWPIWWLLVGTVVGLAAFGARGPCLRHVEIRKPEPKGQGVKNGYLWIHLTKKASTAIDAPL